MYFSQVNTYAILDTFIIRNGSAIIIVFYFLIIFMF